MCVRLNILILCRPPVDEYGSLRTNSLCIGLGCVNKVQYLNNSMYTCTVSEQNMQYEVHFTAVHLTDYGPEAAT